MPVPRKFDRRPPERDQTRINDRIRVPEVRLVGEDGKQIGVVKTSEALAYAQERDLDLVEVAPDARPPVCRVLDYSKYKYEQAQKLKAARKHQQQITVREIKFRPKIAQNDYDTKKGHVTRFLLGKDKVKITIMFRGREVTHPERGTALLDRLAGELSEIAVIEQSPVQDGRNMTMMLAPSKAVLAGREGGKPQQTPRDPSRRRAGEARRAARDRRRRAPQRGSRGRGRRRAARPKRAGGRGDRSGQAPGCEQPPQAAGAVAPPRRRPGGDDAQPSPRARRDAADSRRIRRDRDAALSIRRPTTPPRFAVNALCFTTAPMPKMKTHSGAKKRFKLTANGKVAGAARVLEPHPREEVAQA